VKVLLVRAGALGDIVLLRRAVAGLKLAGVAVGLLAPIATAHAILGPGLSSVDECFDWDDPAFLPLFAEESSGLEGLRPLVAPFGACIAYTGRTDLRRGLERLIPTVIASSPFPSDAHAADSLSRPTLALGGRPPLMPPDLEATEAERAEAEAFVADRLPPGFLALHPGSGSPAKNWPPARFAALARVLGPTPWLLVEGPADVDAARALASSESVVPARGLSARALGVLLAHAGLFVGHDSGVTHLAAAWGVPTLALFGPTDPALWSPVGRRVAVLRSSTGSMLDLSVADVAAAALGLLGGA